MPIEVFLWGSGINVFFSGDRYNKTQEESEKKIPLLKGIDSFKSYLKAIAFSLYTVTLSLDFGVI